MGMCMYVCMYACMHRGVVYLCLSGLHVFVAPCDEPSVLTWLASLTCVHFTRFHVDV